MEPTFTETTSETVTPELAAQIAAAIDAIPPAHQLDPVELEPSESKEAAFVRLQDWAFTKGFALVKESAKSTAGQVVRVYLDCVHHKSKTRNTRKVAEEDRQRANTRTQADGCKFSMVISYQKDLGSWVIRSKHLEHNHAPNPDPFQYHQHRDKIPNRIATLAIATTHRGVVGYREHAAIVEKEGLPKLTKREFWNLQRKEGKGTLTRQEELEYVLQLLESYDVHVRCRFEYILDKDGERIGRVIKDLF
jgi:hypothetical protein